jgi:hypothetical protein
MKFKKYISHSIIFFEYQMFQFLWDEMPRAKQKFAFYVS